MSKSEIRRKHAVDATKLHRRSHPGSPTYKEGPSGKANRRTTQYARKDKVQGPPVSLPDKDEKGEAPLGVGRTLGGVAAKSPNHLPYGEMAETGLQHYK